MLPPVSVMFFLTIQFERHTNCQLSINSRMLEPWLTEPSTTEKWKDRGTYESYTSDQISFVDTESRDPDNWGQVKVCVAADSIWSVGKCRRVEFYDRQVQIDFSANCIRKWTWRKSDIGNYCPLMEPGIPTYRNSMFGMHHFLRSCVFSIRFILLFGVRQRPCWEHANCWWRS